MVDGDGYGKATGSLVELEHVGGEPMATYPKSNCMDFLMGTVDWLTFSKQCLTKCLRGRLQSSLGQSLIRELRSGPDIAMGPESDLGDACRLNYP